MRWSNNKAGVGAALCGTRVHPVANKCADRDRQAGNLLRGPARAPTAEALLRSGRGYITRAAVRDTYHALLNVQPAGDEFSSDSSLRTRGTRALPKYFGPPSACRRSNEYHLFWANAQPSPAFRRPKAPVREGFRQDGVAPRRVDPTSPRPPPGTLSREHRILDLAVQPPDSAVRRPTSSSRRCASCGIDESLDASVTGDVPPSGTVNSIGNEPTITRPRRGAIGRCCNIH
jgi:hypothetical protein